MPEPVKIPIAIFEFTANFERPIVAIWLDRAAIVQSMFDVLTKWNLNIDDVEVVSTGKASDQGIKIRLTDKRCTVLFGPSKFQFTKENASWNTAEETAEILESSLNALRKSSGAVVKNQLSSLSMHFQPTTKSFLDILRPFLPSDLADLREDPLTAGAAIVKWGEWRVILDGSGSLANGVFLRLDQEFDGQKPLAEISEEIHEFERKVFAKLNIEEAAE